MRFAERASYFSAALVFALVFLPRLFFPAAHAALTIEIVGAGGTQLPVAILPFRAEDGLTQKVTPVVAADLTRSGLFKMVDAGGVTPPSEPQDVNYAT